MEQIFQDIREERARQEAKWGSQRNLSSEKWMTILMEEVGEVANAILEGDSVNYQEELVQVAAVAVNMLKVYWQEFDEDSIVIDVDTGLGYMQERADY